jgi:hypothetical protein
VKDLKKLLKYKNRPESGSKSLVAETVKSGVEAVLNRPE